MKQFLYFLTFSVSVGTIGLVATQPQFFQQDGPLFGLRAEGSQNPQVPASAVGDEQLSKFMSDYPYANSPGTAPPYTVAQAAPPPAAETPAGFASTRRPASPPTNDSDVGYASTSGKIPANDSSATFGLFDEWSEPPTPTYQPAPPQYVQPVLRAPNQQQPVPQAVPIQQSAPVQAIMQQPVPPQPQAPQPAAAPVASPAPSQPTPPMPPQSVPVQPTPPQIAQPQPAQPQPAQAIPAQAASPLFAPTPAVPMQPQPQPVEPKIVSTPPPVPPISPAPQAAVPSTEPTVDPFLAALGGPVPTVASAPFDPSPAARPEAPPIPVQSPPRNSVPATLASVAPVALPPEPVSPVPEPSVAMSMPPLPSAAPPRTASQFQINPSVMAEEVPCHGTEMVARVGTEVVLMCDILPQMRRMAHQVFRDNLKQVPEDKRQQVIEEEKEDFLNAWIETNYPAFLRKQIEDALVYNDFKMSKGREERNMIEKKMGEEFDLQDVSGMMKEFGVSDIVELKAYLKDELGSSLERERLLTVRGRIAQQWAMVSIQHAEGEFGQEEMMEYYNANRQEFETKARCRWKEMVVLFSAHKSEKEAWDKIVWMGNKVAGGVSFEEIAKNNSDGFTSNKGGLRDWTSKGSLTSEDVEKAIFTLPVGKLSPIIKSNDGLHIVQVVEREEDKVTPFVEAQVAIRQKIQIQRRAKHADEYFEELKRRYPTIVLRERIDFNLNRKISATPSPVL